MRRMMLGQATLLAASLSMGTVALRREDEDGGAGEEPPMEVLVIDERPPVPMPDIGETRQQRRARERREAKATRRKSK